MCVSEIGWSQAVSLLRWGMGWKTNMFRALEPTTKAEASTRKALEKRIFERLNVIVVVFGFGYSDDWGG